MIGKIQKYVCIRVFIAVIKHQTKSNLGEETVYLAYIS